MTYPRLYSQREPGPVFAWIVRGLVVAGIVWRVFFEGR